MRTLSVKPGGPLSRKPGVDDAEHVFERKDSSHSRKVTVDERSGLDSFLKFVQRSLQMEPAPHR
eukprot:3417878-Rhodomonas_salina.1